MLAVRVLVACLCLGRGQHVLCRQNSHTPATTSTTITASTTIHSLAVTPLLGGQDNGSSPHLATHPPVLPAPAEPVTNSLNCEPERIEVSVKKDDPVIDYRVVVRHLDACKRKIISLHPCHDMTEKGHWFFQEQGKHCLPNIKNGSYKLELEGKQSRCFNLRGTELSHDDLVLNDSVVQVKFLLLPHWAKEWKIRIVDVKGGHLVGNVTTQIMQDTITIPGKYTVDEDYFLWYSFVMPEQVKGECSGENGKHRSGKAYKWNKQVSDAGHGDTRLTVTILGVLLGVVAVGTLICYTTAWGRNVTTLPCCLHKGRTAKPPTCLDVPLIPPTAAEKRGAVLLVHAQDTPDQARLCQDLKAEVIRSCGRNILDITLSDIQRLESLEGWLLKVLSQKENSVVLVMSPALAALDRTLQQDSNAAGSEVVAAVRGKMLHFDDLLSTCLKYLQDHLALDYKRLFLVKFEQANTNDDFSGLVPEKRFLLSQHHQLQALLKALGSCQEKVLGSPPSQHSHEQCANSVGTLKTEGKIVSVI